VSTYLCVFVDKNYYLAWRDNVRRRTPVALNRDYMRNKTLK